MSDYLDPNNEELLKDFFVEAQMQVELLEQNILVLENDTGNRDSVDEIFRAAHTLKGASATVQMDELSGFTHIVEDVLDEIRADNIKVTGDVVDVLLNSIDIIKAMLDKRANGEVYDEDIEEIRSTLKALLEGSDRSDDSVLHVNKANESAGVETSKSDTKETESPGGLSEYDVLELKEAAGKDASVYRVSVHFDESNPMNTVGGIQVFAVLKELGTVLKTNPDFDALYEDNYYPIVDYFIATEKTADVIQGKLDIPEVVTTVEIEELSETPLEAFEGGSESTADKKSERAAAEDPAAPGKTAEAAAPQSEEEKIQDGKDESKQTESKRPEEKVKSKIEEAKKQQVIGSVLRVDSRRIDDLLNLVSESVINKATFNQINSQFSEDFNSLQEIEFNFKERLKDLFDALPQYLSDVQNGKTIKEIKREIVDNFGELSSYFDPFQSALKSTLAKFRSTTQNLARITGDLQEGVMRIRMVPISHIFSRFPRLVRDLSKTLNKNIKLIIEGEDTELDKSVIEDLLDPLIHCVRNSLDHGIENPEEREKNNKDSEGKVYLKASNEGNMILIEVADDGKGIDVTSIREKAIERGVIHPNKVISDVEAYNLIFEPGFSTAKNITNISGRGVGLDVVRKQIEKLNGSVTVWSEKEKGTKFTIKIPLTLAIIQGLLVRVGKEIYAIPITSVIDSHRIRPSDIKMIDNYEVFNVREDVVSLLRLNRLFKIPTDEQKEYHFVVIVGSGEKKVGLVVDSLIGEEDVVIKPLKDSYTNTPGIAGANITGDGSVSLIIDVSQLLDLGLKHEREQRKKRETVIW